jgi:hypothetical protein
MDTIFDVFLVAKIIMGRYTEGIGRNTNGPGSPPRFPRPL